MLLVRTIRVTSQMSENMLVLIYTTQWIHRLTCCGKPVKIDCHFLLQIEIKQASAEVGQQFLAFGKSEKSEFIYIQFSVRRAVVVHVFGGPI